VGGDLDVSGTTTATGGLVVGSPSTCTAAEDTQLRFSSPGGLEVCNGALGMWLAARARPIFWEGGCSVDMNSGAWYYFCTDETTEETAVSSGYLTVSATTDANSTSTNTGRITVIVPGWYRITAQHGSSGATQTRSQLRKNGSAISYILLQNSTANWKTTYDTRLTWMDAGDFFNHRIYSNAGVNSNDDGDYTVDGVDYQRRNFVRVEYLGTDY